MITDDQIEMMKKLRALGQEAEANEELMVAIERERQVQEALDVATKRLELKIEKLMTRGQIPAESITQSVDADMIYEQIIWSVRRNLMTWHSDHVIEWERPSSWWQHIKQRFAPQWLPRRWPVQLDKLRARASVVLPDFHIKVGNLSRMGWESPVFMIHSCTPGLVKQHDGQIYDEIDGVEHGPYGEIRDLARWVQRAADLCSAVAYLAKPGYENIPLSPYEIRQGYELHLEYKTGKGVEVS